MASSREIRWVLYPETVSVSALRGWEDGLEGDVGVGVEGSIFEVRTMVSWVLRSIVLNQRYRLLGTRVRCVRDGWPVIDGGSKWGLDGRGWGERTEWWIVRGLRGERKVWMGDPLPDPMSWSGRLC